MSKDANDSFTYFYSEKCSKNNYIKRVSSAKKEWEDEKSRIMREG